MIPSILDIHYWTLPPWRAIATDISHNAEQRLFGVCGYSKEIEGGEEEAICKHPAIDLGQGISLCPRHTPGAVSVWNAEICNNTIHRALFYCFMASFSVVHRSECLNCVSAWKHIFDVLHVLVCGLDVRWISSHPPVLSHSPFYVFPSLFGLTVTDRDWWISIIIFCPIFS